MALPSEFTISLRIVSGIVASAALLCAQTEDAASRNARQVRQLAKYLSMDWVADGKLQSPADHASAAAAALGMELTDPVLQRAALRYAAISIAYDRGLDLYKGRPAEISDIPVLVKAFVAGITDDEDAKAETMIAMLQSVVVANDRIRRGNDLLAAAVRAHAEIWASLAPAIEACAGPVAKEPFAVAVAAVVGDERTTGLRLRNETKTTLHDVVLAVDSTLATAEQGNVATHTVFVPEWAPQQELLLPPRLMLGAARGGGGAVTYRIAARELRCPDQEVVLAAVDRAVPSGVDGAPVVLPLGRTEAAPKLAPTSAVRPEDATLEQATAWLDQPDLGKAQAAFTQLEAKFSGAASAGEDAASRLATLTAVRYRLAEVYRLRGFAAARTNDDDEGARKLLVLATNKYGALLEAPDVETTREGKSLHAAALRQMVHIDAILCQGYRAIAKLRPKEKSPVSNAKKHENAVKKNLALLEERYSTVTGPDGRNHLETARELVRQLLAK